MNGFLEGISECCKSSPNAVALRQGGSLLTYAELDARADQMAASFCALGLQHGGTVAICLERSFDWIVSALAAMRAGAAYVPIDLAWPDERIRFVVQDSGADVVVARGILLERVAGEIPKVDPARDWAKIAAAGAFEPRNITPQSLAYVIYTSGSTGTPKGVEVTHANLAHLIAWHNHAFAVSAQDRASHVAGLGFDAAVWEIWPYLAAGATLSLVDEMVRTSPELLQGWMVAEAITIGFVPTALATPMIVLPWPAETKLRVLLTGGDTLQKLPRAGLPFAVANNYGPTENTVVTTSGTVKPNGDGVPAIGWPIRGTSVYLLDDAAKPVIAGETGEIYIGGNGVARGYRNRPELTARNFFSDPFSAEPGARMYRSGDRGAVMPDGQIQFFGRIDSQVKIRGHRIELDEIASQLHRHAAVDFAVVTLRTSDAGENYLVAYVLPQDGASLAAAELQEFLLQSLPSAMVPSTFVRLSAIPLSANGKVDRKQLEAPGPDNALTAVSVRQPNSPAEETLLAMVRELLETDAVTVEDDFFLIGGHSLLGTQLVLRARSAFGVELTLRDLFVSSTVESLAATIEDKLIAELDAMTDEEAARRTIF
jgi:amino acid adenylation domain-containing protein